MSADKFFLNLAHVGNTSAASIPVALDEAVKSGFVKSASALCSSASAAALRAVLQLCAYSRFVVTNPRLYLIIVEKIPQKCSALLKI